VLVGIKYCGGCKAFFDRKIEAERTVAAFQDGTFKNAADGESYDALLVICGCNSLCAEVSRYNTDKIIYICEAGGSTEAVKALASLKT